MLFAAWFMLVLKCCGEHLFQYCLSVKYWYQAWCWSSIRKQFKRCNKDKLVSVSFFFYFIVEFTHRVDTSTKAIKQLISMLEKNAFEYIIEKICSRLLDSAECYKSEGALVGFVTNTLWLFLFWVSLLTMFQCKIKRRLSCRKCILLAFSAHDFCPLAAHFVKQNSKKCL